MSIYVYIYIYLFILIYSIYIYISNHFGSGHLKILATDQEVAWHFNGRNPSWRTIAILAALRSSGAKQRNMQIRSSTKASSWYSIANAEKQQRCKHRVFASSGRQVNSGSVSVIIECFWYRWPTSCPRGASTSLLQLSPQGFGGERCIHGCCSLGMLDNEPWSSAMPTPQLARTNNSLGHSSS